MMKNRKIIKKKIKKGFTLIELIAVVAILGVVAIITVPILNNSLKKSREKMLAEQTTRIIEAAQNWNLERIANFEDGTKLGSDIILLLDTSSSMQQNSRAQKMIDAVNDFVITFMNDSIYNRVSIILFNQDVNILLPLDHYNITGGSLFTRAYGYTYKMTSGIFNSERVEIASTNFKIEAGTNTQAGIEQSIKHLLDSYSSDQIPTILLLTDGDPRFYTTSYTSVSTGTSINTVRPISTNEIVNVAYYTLLTANYYKKMFYNRTGDQLNFFTLSFELNEEDLKESLDPSYNFSDEDIRQYINTVINPSEANIDLIAGFDENTLSNLLYKKLFSDSSIDKTNYSYVDYAYNMTNYTAEGLIESLDEMVEAAGLTTFVSIETLVAENFLSDTVLNGSDDEKITGVVKIVYDPVKQKYIYSFYNNEEQA